MIRLSPAQMTALETAGVFEPEDWDGLDLLRAAIVGDQIEASAEIAHALHMLANGADEIGQERGRSDRTLYLSDSRSLTALACKVSRAAVA